ncbi:hypothetical protein [Nioella ostreopsis]|uniref:hypothetical protein n=1 Tax=Nioella ostreopsis TaxID=2448479 RepID=UPI000FD9F6DF|nr:hypothetical protein [Nioella ostreopsis]
MPEHEELHWDHTIAEDTLEALACSRAAQLVNRGMDRQLARYFALLERKEREMLARRVGADEALMARLEWLPDLLGGYACRLVLDDIPEHTSTRFFHGFFPEGEGPSNDD